MNPADVLKYGHLTLKAAIDGIPGGAWQTGGVCGVWSVKDILSHLASYEYLLEEILVGFLGGGETPYLQSMSQDGTQKFNDIQVGLRRGKSVQDVLAEYEAVYERSMALVPRLPVETWRQPGTLPWYGAEYALDDYIVYTFYGHKREHSAQINVFKDTLKGQ